MVRLKNTKKSCKYQESKRIEYDLYILSRPTDLASSAMEHIVKQDETSDNSYDIHQSLENANHLMSKKPDSSEAMPLDCKTSWLACFCASMASFVCVGTCYIYGIFFPAVLKEFRVGKAKTALPGSCSVGFLTILCPVAAIFFNRFGPRVVIPCGGFIAAIGLVGSSFAPNIFLLTFTYGFLAAWGSCLVYMAGFLMVPLYFFKYRSTATGIVSAGPGAGVLIMGPLAQVQIEHFGWRKSMLALAALNLLVGLLGCTLSRKPLQQQQQSSKTRKKIFSVLKDNVSALKNHMLILVICMATTMFMGHYMPLFHLLKFAEDIGISTHSSSWIYPVTGTISTVCRVLTGKVGDSGLLSFYTMFQGGLLFMAITSVLMPLATNVFFLYGYAIAQGVFEAMYFTSGYCLAMLVDPRQGLGWLMFFVSIPMFIGAPIAGYIADASGSYGPVFNTAGGFFLLASLLPFTRHCIAKPESDLEIIYPTKSSSNINLNGLIEERETVV